MDYIYGTADIDGVMRENLKAANCPEYAAGEYLTTVREYDDSSITDRCRIERKYAELDGADGSHYDFYIITDHYRYIDRLKTMAGAKEASAIAFVVLAENGNIDSVTAGEHKEMFEEWKPDVNYTTGQYRNHGGKLYRCLQDHTSQTGWEPGNAPSLWTLAADPAEEWPEWSQPLGAHDAYAMSAKVSHDGKHWISNVDNNVWEPGVYGWTEVTD